MGEISQAVSSFVATTTYENLSQEITDRAKRSVLDLLACSIIGSGSASAPRILDFYAQEDAKSEATAVLHGRQVPAYEAAVINGSFAHATELSETFTRAVVHPGNVVIPAALAVAERDHRSGRDLIAAVMVGYEVVIRAGLSVGGPAFMLQQGFHAPSVLGGFGSTAAVANLARFDVNETLNAFGVAACLTPTCLVAAIHDDAMVKDLFEGVSAGLGVTATDLVRRGITGIHEPFEVWHKAMVAAGDMAPLQEAIGVKWQVNSGGLHFKERALAAMAQPTFDAVSAITAAEDVNFRDIERVIVDTSRRGAIGASRRPRTMVAAKASIPFVVAVALIDQAEVRADPHLVRLISDDRLERSDIAELSDKVEVRVDEDIDTEFEVSWPMKFAARVEITMRDGRQLSAYRDIWPRTSNFAYEDVAQKFMASTADFLSTSVAEATVAEVAALEEIDDVTELMSLLRSKS